MHPDHRHRENEPRAGDALLLIDVQNDFLAKGKLAVPDADAIIPALNRCLALFSQRGLPVLATRDWHPPNHCSFQAQGGAWPPHCIQGTFGAELSRELRIPDGTQVIAKGASPEQEAASGFAGTRLEALLKGLHVRRLFIAGLAADECVRNTVNDAQAAGLAVLVLEDAVRGVDGNGGEGSGALAEMARRGAHRVRVEDLGAPE
jgi:nicotinamidase/pyrazinamidase